jgi:hypothetical protein
VRNACGGRSRAPPQSLFAANRKAAAIEDDTIACSCFVHDVVRRVGIRRL